MKLATFVKLILFLGIASLGYAGYVKYKPKDPEDTFKTEALTSGTIDQTISCSGNVNPVRTVEVGSQVSGNIMKLNADFNSKVKKGDIIAVIEPDTFEAKLTQVQASMDSAQASVVNAQASLRKADADIANSQANLEVQRANLVKAQLTMQDAKSKLDHENTLFKAGMVAGEERDTAETTYETAAAAAKAAQSQISASESSVKASQAGHDVAQTQLTSAQAQTRQIQANLDQAKIDLEHTKILAPVDGTVISRKMDVGQTVAASFSAPTIFEIAEDLTKMQVDANVDESDIGEVEVGQQTSFTVDAYPGQTFPGEVAQIRQAPNIVQNVVTYDVVIAVDNTDLKLLPGMTANVSILVQHRDDALRIPNAALRVPKLDAAATEGGAAGGARQGGARGNGGGQRGQGGGPRGGGQRAGGGARTIYVLLPDGKPKPVLVRLGITDGSYTEAAGFIGDAKLNDGDPIVVGLPASMQTAAAPAGGGNPFAPRGFGGRGRGGRF